MREKTTAIIGVGPGASGYLYPLAADLIRKAELLLGGERVLSDFASGDQDTFCIRNNLCDVVACIKEQHGKKNIAVLATGDTGLYSISAYLQKKLPDIDFQVLPGISSLQCLMAKANINWNQLKIVSLHGKDGLPLKNIVARHPYTAVFAGNKYGPQQIAELLKELSFADIRLLVGEHLSYPEERIVRGSAAEIAEMEFSELSLVIVENPAPAKRPWPYQTMGLPDEAFLRGNAPMTKSEVRAVLHSKLRLTENANILEIGAGTGSCTVEMAMTAYLGHLWALEKDPGAAALCRANIERFAVDNVTLIEENAPAGIPSDMDFDAVFIGGSGGQMAEIVAAVAGRSKRVVVTAVTAESVGETLTALAAHGYETEIVQLTLARSKKAGTKHLMQALNPITIITGVPS
ncbi:MAG TPA: precorrin-6y C5,15-methyltransferase (decarboxylating) subunit CbiE [Clostridiales bacterium]|nr:precorrin-6y C5,15-methyltransferase (decarboxylating) subunit CbiE [Clostridiales bacterium]